MSRITKDTNIIANQLLLGNVVSLPTETVYGLAADVTNDDAVRKIFAIKNRPINHPLIMHVAPDWDISQWVEYIPEYAINFIKDFWPGPLTLVFKLKEKAKISKFAVGEQQTIAIRSPAHPLALDVLNKLGKPLVAPSANPFGKVSPTEAQHVLQDFPEFSFAILDGGPCSIGIESTIINCTSDNSCSILRPGMISELELKNSCNFLQSKEYSNIRVSGNLKTHYQPQKKLFYFDYQELSDVNSKLSSSRRFYILCFSLIFAKDKIGYLFSSSPEQAASEFYRQLRIADKSDADAIIIELPPKTSNWMALIERIKKAGTSFFA